MHKKKNKWILHPFLFAIYPIFFLYAANSYQTYFSDTFRTLAYMLTGTAVLFLFFRIVSRDWYKSSLLTSLSVLLFTTYGHLYSVYSNANIIAAVYAALFILAGWSIIRIVKNPIPANTILNAVSIAILCIPVFQSVYYKVSILNPFSQENIEESVTTEKSTPVQNGRAPDIYYIILDEYARSDVMKEYLGFDNSPLVAGLRERNFYIAENSHANYGVSYQSITSALNLGYVNQPETMDRNEPSTKYLKINEVQNSKLRSFLQKNGYKVITFATGYSLTDIKDSDLYVAPEGYLTEFEMLFIRRTALIFGSDRIYESQTRGLILNGFDRLKSMPDIEPNTPKFIFAHIPATHVPFVFGPNGEEVDLWSFPASFENYAEVREGYSKAYSAQAQFISRQVIETVDAILKKSKPKPVIILQSDHGSQLYYDWNYVQGNRCFKERMSIFNAYYFPDGNYQNLYPSITPVNTFRIIFNQFYKTELPLLEDRTFYSTQKKPVTFFDVTDQVNQCQLPEW